MKIFRLAFLLALLASCTTSTPPKEQTLEKSVEPSTPTDVVTQPIDTVATPDVETKAGQVVYVTKEGDKYHTADCRYSKNALAVTLKQAKADGKTACDQCKPNSITGDKQMRCTAKTSDGTQCKRMTTNTSGRCFQHAKP